METQANNTVNNTIGSLPSVPVSRKYGVFQSLQEMLGTAKRNPITFAAALIVSYAVSAIVLTLTFYAMTNLILSQFVLLFASFGKIIIFLIVALLVYTLLYALVYAFTVSSVSLSLSSEKSGVGSVVKRALAITPRILKVNAWVAVIAYWPIAVAAFLPLLLLSRPGVGNSPIALLAPILIIVALIWAIIANLRYALAPYVAIFEPEVPVKQTLRRSQELLKTGGQWFIFKGFLMLFAIFIVLGIVTKSSLNELGNTSNWTINIIFVVLSVLIEGAMVMLYFNRANKQDTSNTPKSPGLLAVVIVVLLGLIGIAAWQGQSNKIDGTFSAADQKALLEPQESVGYQKNSLNNAVKPADNSIQSQSTTTSTTPPAQQPTAQSANTNSTSVLYRIAADGNSAQLSPVTITLTGPTVVNLTIDLQCLGTCRFKLASDNSAFSDTAIYTSSQKIKYILTKPGEYILYNQFTPDSKFKIKF